MAIIAILFYLIYRKVNQRIEMDFEYPHEMPQSKDFPEKYGLGIELNSRYQFAIQSYDIEFLRRIEQRIHSSTTIPTNKTYNFNLSDNSVNIEKFDVDKVENVNIDEVNTDDFYINEGE